MNAILRTLNKPRGVLIAVLLAILAGAAGAFTAPVLDRDEGRYVQATAQMLESGDFVRIRFMDEPRSKKPVGIHWLQAASVAAFSDVEARQVWAWRLPSILGAAIAAFAAFLAGRALLGARPATAGAMMLAVCVLLGLEAGIAKTDAALLGACALMMAALAHLKFSLRAGETGWRTALGFWAALAVGVLIKGPIAPLLAVLTLGALFAWERSAAWARPLLRWPGPLLFAAIALPWFVAVELTEDGFLREAFSVDFGPKLISAAEGHAGPPGYHTLALLLQLWPATLFLLPGLVLAWRGARASRQAPEAAPWRFLIAWALPFLLVFEIAPTKLPHYVLPAYPAFALIAGAGFAALLDGARMKRAETASAILFGLGALVWIAIAIVLAWMFGAEGARIAAVLTGIAAGALALAALIKRRRAAGLALAVLAALVWHIGARGIVAPRIEPFTLSARLAQIVPPEARPLAVADYREPSLIFLLGGEVGFVAEEAMAQAAGEGRFAAYAAPRAQAAAVRDAIEARHGCAGTLGEIAGLNYSNGRMIDLVVLAPGRSCPRGDGP